MSPMLNSLKSLRYLVRPDRRIIALAALTAILSGCSGVSSPSNGALPDASRSAIAGQIRPHACSGLSIGCGLIWVSAKGTKSATAWCPTNAPNDPQVITGGSTGSLSEDNGGQIGPGSPVTGSNSTTGWSVSGKTGETVYAYALCGPPGTTPTYFRTASVELQNLAKGQEISVSCNTGEALVGGWGYGYSGAQYVTGLVYGTGFTNLKWVLQAKAYSIATYSVYAECATTTEVQLA